MQVVQQKPFLLVPEESRSQFEMDVFDIYEKVADTQTKWGIPEFIPLAGTIYDQSVDSFREVASLLEFGDRFAWFKLPDILKWQDDAVEKYSRAYDKDLFSVIFKYHMSVSFKNRKFINFPVGKVW
jgi:hypothetical protein